MPAVGGAAVTFAAGVGLAPGSTITRSRSGSRGPPPALVAGRAVPFTRPSASRGDTAADESNWKKEVGRARRDASRLRKHCRKMRPAMQPSMYRRSRPRPRGTTSAEYMASAASRGRADALAVNSGGRCAARVEAAAGGRGRGRGAHSGAVPADQPAAATRHRLAARDGRRPHERRSRESTGRRPPLPAPLT